MIGAEQARGVHHALFSTPGTNVFAVLDGASVADLPQLLWQHKPEHACLYSGELGPDMRQVAPYLVRLDPDSPMTELVIGAGWGQHWGIFAVAPKGLIEMRKQFRRYLVVKDPDGKTLAFRFYDPRVLRVYLPTCNAHETQEIFGPIRFLALEDEDPSTMLKCMPGEQSPVIQRISLKAEAVAAGAATAREPAVKGAR